ncbi:MAG: hypothetical protein HOP11_12615, partial [Saprospiraceae bacterium]|nr:hypothetical protein [Saprospiraceae bacterium]
MFNNVVHYALEQDDYECEDAINVYLYDRFNISGFGGAAYKWTNKVYSSVTDIPTLAHEFGHVLGLHHTHECRCSMECVDGSNCGSSGDQVCDTPADFWTLNEPKTVCNAGNRTDNIFYNEAICKIFGATTGCNGDPYAPSYLNLMSYYPHSCGNKTLTQGQANRLKNSSLLFFSNAIIEKLEIISGITIWNTNKIISNSILVKSGATLNINSCTVSFNPRAGIIVEEGGTLNVISSTLTLSEASSSCAYNEEEGGFWKGIHCRISSSNTDFSVINISSSNVIRAKIAIGDDDVLSNSTFYTGNKASMDLVVNGSSELLNNPTGVLVGSPTSKVNFLLSKITTNSDMPWSSWFVGFNLFDNKNTYILQSHLNNSKTSTIFNRGIDAVSAGFRVSGGTIKGYKEGIYSWTHSVSRPFFVTATFENFSNGIRVEEVDNFSVSSCIFNSNGTGGFSRKGILINDATGFKIRGNQFNKGLNSDPLTGIQLVLTDVIEKNLIGPFNSFSSNSSGIKVENLHDNLFIVCNSNINNTNDILIENNGKIGTPHNYDAKPAGNSFTQNGAVNINNKGISSLEYHYNGSIQDQIPVNVINTGLINKASSNNTCITSGTGTDGTSWVQLFQNIDNLKNQVQVLESSLNQLLDNGLTSYYLNLINSSTSFNSNLWTEILNLSPNVSKELAKVIIERNDLFTDQLQLDLLFQNPNLNLVSLNNEELSKLVQKYLSSESILQLNNLQLTNNNRTQIELQLLSKIQKYHSTIDDYLMKTHTDIELNDQDQLEYRLDLYNRKKSLSSSFNIALEYLNQGLYNSANNYLNSLHNILLIDEFDLAAINNFKTYINFINQKIHIEGKNIRALTIQDQQELLSIALETSYRGSLIAKNILINFYNYNFESQNTVSED